MTTFRERFAKGPAVVTPGQFATGVALLIAAAFAVYWPALHGAWLWDDVSEVTQTPVLRSPGGFWQTWLSPQGPDYFPLKTSLQWLEWHLWQDNPTGYHVVSILTHGLGAVLVWRLLARISVPFSFFAGLLFALHPICAESVAWIAEQKNTFSLPLAMGSMILFVDHARTGANKAYVASLILFVLSLLTKTSAVGLPFALLAFLFLIHDTVRRTDLAKVAPFFAAALVLGLVTTWFQSHVAIGAATLPIGSLPTRIAEASHALFFYLRKSLVPFGYMSAYPAFSPVFIMTTGIGLWIVAGALVALAWSKRRTGAFFTAIFFLISVGPILGIIPLSWARISPVSDHFAYLSLIPVVGLVAAGAGWLLHRIGSGSRPVIQVILAVIAVGLGLETRLLAARYRDPITFWNAAAQANPRSYVAHYNLGNAFRSTQQDAKAAGEYIAAVRENPAFALARSNLADLRFAQGKFAEAQAGYQSAISLDPKLAPTYLKLAKALAAQGHFIEAARADQAANGLDPTNAQAEYESGFNLLQAGRPPEDALPLIERASVLDPTDAQTLSTLGMLRAQLGHADQAIAACTAAVRIDPNNARFRNNLGNCFLVAGKIREAIDEYSAALRLEPAFAEARTNLELARERLGR